MTTPVFVSMPLHVNNDMMSAVRADPLTSVDDKDEMNLRIGWLICAYEVMVKTQTLALTQGETSGKTLPNS